MPRRLSLILIGTLLLGSNPSLAQEEPSAPPAGTIIVEQSSEVDSVGTWAIIMPNHESHERTGATLTMPNMPVGKYTFIAKPPKGTTAVTEVHLGDDVLQRVETPQISFDLQDTMTLRVTIAYALTVSGKVGVNSEPIGIPFELQGPNDMRRKGVTPAEYPKMPIGNYAVVYKPEGCPQPPQKAATLEQYGRADFMLELSCKTFRPVEREVETHVTTELGGTEFAFTDVSTKEWFAAYVATVAKRGLITGYRDAQGKPLNRFGPGDPVTVAQLAKIVHAFQKIDQNLVPRAPWNKQAIGAWYTRYIASAEELGWLVYVDGTVDPNRPATRAEVLVTLLHALDIPMTWAKGEMFTDVKRSTLFGHAVETSAKLDIVSGVRDAEGKLTGEFHPKDPVTRAEMAKIIIVLHEKYHKEPDSGVDR